MKIRHCLRSLTFSRRYLSKSVDSKNLNLPSNAVTQLEYLRGKVFGPEILEKSVHPSNEVFASLIEASSKSNDLKTMRLVIAEAVRNNSLDFKMLDKLIQNYTAVQAFHKAAHLLKCIDSVCGYPSKDGLSEETLIELLEALLNYEEWGFASTTAIFMLNRNLQFGDRQLNKVFRTSLGTVDGIEKSLTILSRLAKVQRNDASTMRSNRAIRVLGIETVLRRDSSDFSFGFQVKASVVESTFNSILESYKRNGWVSNELNRLTIGIAAACGMHSLVVPFVRAMVTHKFSDAHLNNSVDRLQMLQVMAVAPDLAASCHFKNNGPAHFWATYGREVTRPPDLDKALETSMQGILFVSCHIIYSEILDLLVESLPLFNLQATGLRAYVNFLETYWVLNHKVALWHGRPLVADPAMTAHYKGIVEFIKDPSLPFKDYVLPAGFDRRLIRHLCDELRLPNSLLTETFSTSVPSPVADAKALQLNNPTLTNILGIRLFKPKMNENVVKTPSYPTLKEILIRDSKRGPHRLFDGRPRHWDKISQALQHLSESELGLCVGMVTNALTALPSPSWAFLFLSVLHDKQKEMKIAPSNFYSVVLIMCNLRQDAFGAIEALAAAVAEDKVRLPSESVESIDAATSLRGYDYMMQSYLQNGYKFNENDSLSQIQNQARYSHELIDNEETDEPIELLEKRSVEQPLRLVDKILPPNFNSRFMRHPGSKRKSLSNTDWSRACTSVWKTRDTSALNERVVLSRRLSEVLMLMRINGLKMDASVSRTVLKFLMSVDPEGARATKIFSSIAMHKQRATYVECVAATKLLLSKLNNKSWMSRMRLITPLYESENYLLVLGDTIVELENEVRRLQNDFGAGFVYQFAQCWEKQHSSKGRNDLYALLLNLVTDAERMRVMRENMPVTGVSDSPVHKTLSQLCIISAYQMGFLEGNCIQAYSLLSAMNAVMSEDLHADESSFQYED